MSYPPFYAQVQPTFQPAMRAITAITNSNPAIVTTNINHNYVTNTIIRLDIPVQYGMQQANQQFGPITVTSNTTFTIPIDTTLFDKFIVPATPNQQAQTIAFAEDASILTAAVQNVLPYP